MARQAKGTGTPAKLCTAELGGRKCVLHIGFEGGPHRTPHKLRQTDLPGFGALPVHNDGKGTIWTRIKLECCPHDMKGCKECRALLKGST